MNRMRGEGVSVVRVLINKAFRRFMEINQKPEPAALCEEPIG